MPRNPYLCLAIVGVLGTCALAGMVGMIVLGIDGRDPPAALVAIASSCIGSLASFLVSVPRGTVGYDTQPSGAKP